MRLIAYYEGSDDVRDWLKSLINEECDFRKLPTSNFSDEFFKLPGYVADILYLDKPDIIVSGRSDGVHERPLFSVELASCTPQYQHAVQRFSRMLASAKSGCPSVLIMPRVKRENSGGNRLYNRSAAVDYGAVRLSDVYKVPAFVVDWPSNDGNLLCEPGGVLPQLADPEIQKLGTFLRAAVDTFFKTTDYLGGLSRISTTQDLLDRTRQRAYAGGAPTISSPGGGPPNKNAKLDLIKTTDLLSRLVDEGRATPAAIARIPPYFTSREYSLLFYPTRIVEKAGDPYVGMLAYYDIAFCRIGESTRDRKHNLVAYCNNVSRSEVTDTMRGFNTSKCPFVQPLTDDAILSYSYHLRDGCSKTKIKPIRIYAEMTDLVAYDDGILVTP